MFSSQSFVKAQIDSQLPASNTMPNAATQTEPEMPMPVLRLKLWFEWNNPGRAVTLADIKAAPVKLRNSAMKAMVYSLSLEQKYKYKKCQSDCERHMWVEEYMLDPAKVRCKGIEASNSFLKTRRKSLLEGIAVAKKRLRMADAQLEMAKMRRAQICEEIGMKSNTVTLIDAQLDN